MASSSEYQNTRGTVLATFTQTGTFSNVVDLGGGWLVGAYSDNYPTAAGSIIIRSTWNPSGTGWPVQTLDGTALKILAFGSGTYYSLGHAPWNTAPLQYVTLQIGTAGTTAAAGGGTIVLVTGV
jgi:hypothetical protein